MHEQYSIPSRTATTETMSHGAHETYKTRRRLRFWQPHATYKFVSAANIPNRNVLVEIRRVKHLILWKQEEWCNIVFDDRTSSDIEQRKDWCEIFSLMLKMSMIVIQNAWTIQLPFKDGNNRDNELTSRGENNKKTKIPTDSHSPMPLTNSVPLLTSQSEMSWLKAVALINIKPCESRQSIVVLLLLMIGVVAILDKEKNGVRLLVWWWWWEWL